MQSDLPKTINEAIKILAYNDYFWHSVGKTPNIKINPHPKDLETVKSLAEAQYAWTEKQAKLALMILKRYLTKFQSHGMDITELLHDPQYEQPFRVISFLKSIEKYKDSNGDSFIELKFPYQKKLIQLIRTINNKKGLPTGYGRYDGEDKKWTFKQTDLTTYYLTLIAIRYDFEFVDKTLLDDYFTVKDEIRYHKRPTAILDNNEIVIKNAAPSLQEYWKENCQGLSLIQKIDKIKEFEILYQGKTIEGKSTLSTGIANSKHKKLWIDRNKYTRNEILSTVEELQCYPFIMPVSGDPYTQQDSDDWNKWLKSFSKFNIEPKHMAFGLDIREPIRAGEKENPIIENWTDEINETRYQILMEIHQLSKQFKFIDKQTKVIFVRNRIPRTLIRSNIKPKCTIVALGGGYYTAGTDSLKRYLDSLPKTLYYNDHRPMNWQYEDNTIAKL